MLVSEAGRGSPPTAVCPFGSELCDRITLEEGMHRLDLEQRVRDAPKDAHVRGMFYQMVVGVLESHSHDLLQAWRSLARPPRRWAVRFYSLRDFLREQALAAVLLDPSDPHRALRQIWRGTPDLYPNLHPARFAEYLARGDPVRVLRWLERNRGVMVDYGGWRVDVTGPRAATFSYFDEFVWIEHAQAGGVEGTLARCGLSCSIEPELSSAYLGRLHIRW